MNCGDEEDSGVECLKSNGGELLPWPTVVSN